MKITASILAWVALIAFFAGIVFAVPVFGRLADPFDSKFEYVGGDAYNLINASVQASAFAIFSSASFIICVISAAFSSILNGLSEQELSNGEREKLKVLEDRLLSELNSRFLERQAARQEKQTKSNV